MIEKAEWFSPRPRTQGVAIIQPESSSLSHGVALIEIAYLTTSLRNCPKIVNGVAAGEGFYRGVGLSLMTIAGELSTANGFGGLIGLYALLGAVPFYKKVGLTMHPSILRKRGSSSILRKNCVRLKIIDVEVCMKIDQKKLRRAILMTDDGYCEAGSPKTMHADSVDRTRQTQAANRQGNIGSVWGHLRQAIAHMRSH